MPDTTTYVAHLVQRDAGRVTAAQHLRLNATTPTAAKRRLGTACAGWHVEDLRPAGPRDVQRWLHA